MAKKAMQKTRLLHLLKFLWMNSDENHYVSMSQILSYFESVNMEAERKSIYDDVKSLEDFGISIELKRGRNGGYRLVDRIFSLAELRMLVDAVQASKFITQKKSEQLIHKLELLTSVPQGRGLQHSVIMRERVKTMNESVFSSVDKLHEAMAENKKVSFQYFDWNVDGTRKMHNDGLFYCVSPLALTWDDENYYLIAFDGKQNKHFRVDKMLRLEKKSEAREGANERHRFDTARYSKQHFGMYGGEITKVNLRCDKSLSGVIVDRFGSNLFAVPENDSFKVTVSAAVSPVFFGWVMSFGDKMEILSPENVRQSFIEHTKNILKKYSE